MKTSRNKVKKNKNIFSTPKIRLEMSGRYRNREIESLDKAIILMKAKFPTAKTIACCFFSDNAAKALSNHPRVIRKGRWFYYVYNDELIYIKVLIVKHPESPKNELKVVLSNG